MVSIVIGNIMMGISILINVITMQQKDKKNIIYQVQIMIK